MSVVMRVAFAAMLLPFGLPATAQNFTSAAEVRPILDLTKANWVAVREFDGQDLVYFTGVLSWRCGLTELHYGLNGEAPVTQFPMEPCYADQPAPNAFLDEAWPIYMRQPLGSVQTVTVRVLFDDGESTEVTLDRANIMTP
jgi:hypothetical protein